MQVSLWLTAALTAVAAALGQRLPSQVGFLLTCLTGCALLALRGRAQAVSLLRNLRAERTLHYLGLFLLGVWLSHSPEGQVLAVVTGSVSVFLVWLAAVVNNDIADLQIDRLSNPHRPLVTGAWAEREYARLGLAFGALGLLGALCVSLAFWLCILSSLAIALLYSSRPFRLRRWVGVSSLTLALAGLAVTCGGFLSMGNRTVAEFPSALAWMLVLGVGCGANFKDVKDYRGDTAERVQTVVTLLGLRRGQFVAGLLLAAAIISAPLLLKTPQLLLPSLCWAMLGLFICTRRHFREKLLFVLYFSYIALLVVTGAIRPVA